MLLMSVRLRPWRALLLRSSLGRCTSRVPSSAFATVIGSATEWLREPFGPLTVTTLPSSCTSTPEGTGTGSLPMRDIAFSSPGFRLPDVGEDFPTHALLVSLTVGQQAGARRDDRDTEATED